MTTKTPWPPVDGGRLLVWNTLEALAGAGHAITLVAPLDPRSDGEAAEKKLGPFCRPCLVRVRPVPLAAAATRALFTGRATSVVRHTLPSVGQEVARCLRAEAFDVVVAEQVQALAQCDAAFQSGMRVVWRAQNVESDLWRATADQAWWASWMLRREARLLAAYEADAVRRTARTIALTANDADRLGTLSGARDRIDVVPVPFPSELPPADRPLPGSPAVVLFGSAGWWPNAHGARWFLREAWPRVRAALPEAQLHVFGMEVPLTPGISQHPAPSDSRDAFAPGSILVVPLFVASGVRMKILEAWARGVPVVATPQAASGLGQASQGLLIAEDGAGFQRALGELARSEGSRLDHGRKGKDRVRTDHAGSAVVRLLEQSLS